MSTDENALARRLARWLRCFSMSSVRWGTVNQGNSSGRTRYGAIVELYADVTDFLLDEDDEFEHLLQLREAIDLVRLTLAVQPQIATEFYRKSRRSLAMYGLEDEEISTADEEAWAAVARGVPAELRLRFHFNSLKTRMLAPQLVASFMVRMGRHLSRNADYVATRNELMGRIQDHCALQRPVTITLRVDSPEIEDFSLLEAEDFFIGLGSLARLLKGEEIDLETGEWARENKHTPLAIDKIELSLLRFCITHRVVLAAQAFMDAGVPVDCKRLSLDLRLISCAEDDLSAFVTAITRGSSQLTVYTGVDPNEEDIEPIDMEGQDRTEIVEMILRVIASVEHLHEVSLGGLLTLCCQPENRQAILRSVVEQFSTRAEPLNSLSLGHDLMFDRVDGAWIEGIANEFRASHPDAKLRVKRLELMFADPDSARELTRILSAFDDMEQIHTGARLGGRPITPDPAAILRFPSLRRVHLYKVHLSSMDLFDPTITSDPQLPSKPPVLEELVLDEVEFRDIESVARFVKTLQPPSQSELATALRVLQISPIYGNPLVNQIFFDHEAMLTLDDVLQSNRVLSKLAISIDPEEVALKDSKRLRKHNGIAIPVALATRRADYVKARNVAFLSVIREDSTSARSGLDARVISLIFDFSAPHVGRNVRVDEIEDPEDDED